ncbi:Brp/Blh family beta-carotene 15,15'-dioxygenase [Halorubellus sp. PRR65]|uniref:Brp/Blh family beta-carotene 15,15'-dioxygenase n=1 Tax=Halorubellus sp. PRR65 TaxID=3098148 RepID=UPI002B260590|nr:Brp/Blh family beta-carotene 15,15'-dioxygenase [Halorubellus sp. PRR65]
MTERSYRVRSTPAASVRDRVVALGLAPSWAVVGVLALAFAAGVDRPPLSVQLVPLVASVVLFGLPHGAVDHLALARAGGQAATRAHQLRVGALYAVLGGAYAVAWFVAPVAAAVAFVLLTWAHWGQGDLYPLVSLFDGRHPHGRGQRALTAAVRGALPMTIPLVAFPGQYERVLGWFVAPFGANTDALAWLFTADSRLAVAGAVGALTVLALANGSRTDGASAAWVVDVAETLALWAFFLLVPPILAVGAYFSAWHALRHVARLVTVDDDAVAALERGSALGALAAFARDAAPLTAGALVVLAALAVAVPTTPTALPGLVGLYLVGIAVLTLPHVAVVTGMDRHQGVL